MAYIDRVYEWLRWHDAATLIASSSAVAILSLQMLCVTLGPAIVVGVFSRSRQGSARAVCAALSLLVFVLGYMHPAYATQLGIHGLGMLYYAALSIGVYRFERSSATRNVGREVLAAILLVFYLFAPAVLFRGQPGSTVLLAGWSRMLGAYSYLVDARRDERAPSLRTCLFFLLVDPSLVFPVRGHGAAPCPAHSLRRLGGGAAMIVLGNCLTGWVTDFAQLAPLDAPNPWQAATLLLRASVALTWAFSMFLVRAGFAHAEIGLLRLQGIKVRESFDRPYLANSPLDFWRRWNLWVGDWARRYLFSPLSLHLRRTHRGSAMTWIVPVSVLWTFGAMGLFHDLLIYCAQGQSAFPYLSMFLFSAVSVIAFEAARVRARQVLRWMHVPADGIAAGQRALFVVYLVTALRALGTI